MTVSWAWYIEAYLGGSWVDISDDVLQRDDITGDEGIRGIGPSYHVANSGTLSFYLDNGQSNSGKKIGYYSPGHTNCRSGFALGLELRVKFTYAARTEYYKYYVTNITPSPGQFRERKTKVQAADYMWKLSTMKLSGIGIQVNQRPDQVIDTVMNSVADAPETESYATEPFSMFEYSLHGEKDEKSTITNVMQKIVQSTGGYLFKSSNSTNGETLTYEHRMTRYLRTVIAAFDNTMSDITVDWNEDQKIDGVRLTYNPGRVDPTDVVLGTLPSEITLAPGESRLIELRLRDPNGLANRVSAVSYAAQVAGTDYCFSSISGNNGTDLNASLGITPDTSSANTWKATVVNNASVPGYLKTFQVRGKGFYLYETLDEYAGAADPVNEMSYEMPYVSTNLVAKPFAQMLYLRGSNASVPQVGETSFYADYSAAMMGYFLDGTIGQAFTVSEQVTGVSTLKFFINHRKWKISKGSLYVTWLGEPAETVQYMQLDIDQLDGTKVLG